MTLSANPWLPQLVLCSTAVLILLLGRFLRTPRLWGLLGFLAIAAAAGILIADIGDGETTAGLQWDRFAVAISLGVLFLGGVLNLCTWQPDREPQFSAERQSLLLAGTATATASASADNLLLIFGSLEICTLIAAGLLWKRRADSDQPPGQLARRSLVLQGVSCILILIAAALLVRHTSTSNFIEIRGFFSDAKQAAQLTGIPMLNDFSLRLTVAFLFSGLGMRLMLVPMHFGQPEVFIGADALTRGYLITLSRAVGVIVLFRLLFLTGIVTPSHGIVLAAVLGSLTMLIGTSLAVGRPTLRETLTYLVIGQGGVILAGLAAAWGRDANAIVSMTGSSPLLQGETAAALSVVSAMLSFAGLVALLKSIRREDREADFLDDLKGLMRDRPLVATSIAVLLFNLVGIPPLAGFWSRLSTWGALLSVVRETGEGSVSWHPTLFLMVIAVGIHAVITATIAFRLIAAMVFDPPVAGAKSGRDLPAMFAGAICAVLTILIGLSPTRTAGWLDAIIPAHSLSPQSPQGGGSGNSQATTTRDSQKMVAVSTHTLDRFRHGSTHRRVFVVTMFDECGENLDPVFGFRADFAE